MNEYNALKGFLNCLFVILIVCFSFFAIVELMWIIQSYQMIWDFPIHLFIVYMISDFALELNKEGHLILATRLRRKIQLVRFVELYRHVDKVQNV